MAQADQADRLLEADEAFAAEQAEALAAAAMAEDDIWDLMKNEAKRQKTKKTKVGEIVKYRALNGKKYARVSQEFKRGGSDMLLVTPVEPKTGNVF